MAETYVGLQINTIGDLNSITLETFQFRELKQGEVLIKMETSVINPVDYYVANGYFGPGKLLGIEGSGTVVKSGGGEIADSLVNKRVALSNRGTWAEYSVASAESVYPLVDSTTFEQAATLIVNPFTVAAFAEVIQQGNHKAVAINAAASALGKMLIKWGKKFNVPIISLVRKQEQVDTLHALGAEHVFNTSEEGWKKNAKALAETLGASVGFECVGGTSAGDLVDIINQGGIVYTYGNLSHEPSAISPYSLIFERKRLQGYGRIAFFQNKTHEEKLEVGRQVQESFDVFGTEYSKEISLTEVKAALVEYSQGATNNKILIRTRVN